MLLTLAVIGAFALYVMNSHDRDRLRRRLLARTWRWFACLRTLSMAGRVSSARFAPGSSGREPSPLR